VGGGPLLVPTFEGKTQVKKRAQEADTSLPSCYEPAAHPAWPKTSWTFKFSSSGLDLQKNLVLIYLRKKLEEKVRLMNRTECMLPWVPQNPLPVFNALTPILLGPAVKQPGIVCLFPLHSFYFQAGELAAFFQPGHG
jgi:hypothetical protein